MKLKQIRLKIDEIDKELVSMLERRLELGLRTRRYKKNSLDNSREQMVLKNAKKARLALVEESFIDTLFKTIMDESKRLQDQHKILVAFQGEHGAYSEMASRNLVPDGVYIPCSQFSEVFDGVADGSYDMGVVPVENSLEGAVTQVNNLLTGTELKVKGETVVPIHHCLLAAEDTDPDEIKQVYSHPQALAQCGSFIEAAGYDARPFYDTAGAAKMLIHDKTNAAAIASPLCADLYGLKVIKEHIEDDHSNSTRFLLLSKQKAETGNKCSLIFSTPHQSGKLLEALKIFADAAINLTRIASMPNRKNPGNYNFFLDFEGSDQNPEIAKAIKAVQQLTADNLFLGCYPKYNG
jgi:prephenate dehydratase